MTRRLLTVLFPTVLLLCAAACQSDGDTPSDAVTRTDSAGIEVVTNLADPGSLPRRALSLVPELDITRDSEVRLEAREVFRLGSVDGPDEETLFGRVLGVELDDDGNVYVLDGLAPAVRVFDSDGQYVRSLGGRGAGPGEFMRPNGLIIAEDGRLWVRDSGNRRYEVFESDGTFAGSFRRNFRGGLGNLVIDPDGLIWESASTAMDPVTFARELFFVGARPLSGVMESVETVHLAQPMHNIWTVLPTNGEGGFVSVPFTAEWRARIDPRGGFWTGTTDALRFIRHAREGDTIQVIQRAVSPRPVSAEERDLAFGELIDRFGRAALQGSASQIPDYMPYWNTFFLDSVGRLWVERYRPPGTPADTLHMWEIYGPDGALLGVLPLPLSGRVTPSVRNDRVAGVVEDDLGVQYVVVFELAARTS